MKIPHYVHLVISGVTMGWLLRLVTAGPTGKGALNSLGFLND